MLLGTGRCIPADTAVVSLDNSYYSDLCPVRITSPAHKAHRLGGMAGRQVQSQSITWRLVCKESG